jgi:hypothetical protein
MGREWGENKNVKENGLSINYITTWFYWSRWPESNWWPTDYELCAVLTRLFLYLSICLYIFAIFQSQRQVTSAIFLYLSISPLYINYTAAGGSIFKVVTPCSVLLGSQLLHSQNQLFTYLVSVLSSCQNWGLLDESFENLPVIFW